MSNVMIHALGLYLGLGLPALAHELYIQGLLGLASTHSSPALRSVAYIKNACVMAGGRKKGTKTKHHLIAEVAHLEFHEKLAL